MASLATDDANPPAKLAFQLDHSVGADYASVRRGHFGPSEFPGYLGMSAKYLPKLS
jgi:hypothetical protein